MNHRLEQRFADLKASGASPVDAIKAVHREFGLSLADSKQAFASSPAWARESENGARLHEEIIRVLDGGPNL